MRIISEFHDYYDSALSYGSDPDLLYIRKKELFEFKLEREEKKYLPNNMDECIKPIIKLVTKLPHTLNLRKRQNCELHTAIIGICGRLYPMIMFNDSTNKNFVFYNTDNIVRELSNPDNFHFKLDCIKKEDIQEALDKKSDSTYSWLSHDLTHDGWNKITSQFIDKTYDSVFIGLKVPVFKLELFFNDRNFKLTLNNCLKDDQFQKLKTPVECFQEISMYLGNQLAVQADPNTKISDDVLRDKKGFDKWSFRNKGKEKTI